VEASSIIRRARRRSGLTLRALARRAGTSHSALAAYESGRVTPTVDTFERIVRAAGFTVTATLTPAVDADAERARELAEVLELAGQFPARHAREIEYPRFGPR
jgi:transcriptional regulator with XRE-family HTH domain